MPALFTKEYTTDLIMNCLFYYGKHIQFYYSIVTLQIGKYTCITVVKMDGFWVKQCIVVNFESTLPTRAGIRTSRILGLWEHNGDTVVSHSIHNYCSQMVLTICSNLHFRETAMGDTRFSRSHSFIVCNSC